MIKILRDLFVWFVIITIISLAHDYKVKIFSDALLYNFTGANLEKIDRAHARYMKSSDDHFYIKAKINNVPIRLMLDTGATDVVLNLADSVAVGINVNDLSFNHRYETANGFIYGAHARIGTLSIGPFVLKNSKIAISNNNYHSSVVGMNALRYFTVILDRDILIITK